MCSQKKAFPQMGKERIEKTTRKKKCVIFTLCGFQQRMGCSSSIKEKTQST
jgi:hypothetical protein